MDHLTHSSCAGGCTDNLNIAIKKKKLITATFKCLKLSKTCKKVFTKVRRKHPAPPHPPPPPLKRYQDAMYRGQSCDQFTSSENDALGDTTYFRWDPPCLPEKSGGLLLQPTIFSPPEWDSSRSGQQEDRPRISFYFCFFYIYPFPSGEMHVCCFQPLGHI